MNGNSTTGIRSCLRKVICLLAVSAMSCAAGSVPAAGAPAMEIRLGSGEPSVDRYEEYGYNAAILGDVTQLASFDTTYPGVIAPDSALRKRIDQQRRKFLKEYDRANELGLAVYLMADEVSMPTLILEQLGKKGRTGDPAAMIDFDSPVFWDAYRAKYREVLRAYPRVTAVIVRTGENYSHADEGFTGRTVLDKKYDDDYFRHMQRLIEETRKIVVDEFGRTLVWRTWDLGNEGFHANPAVYDRVLRGLPNRKGLVLAVKNTQTDFWRYNDFNPMIGRGQIDQIVEFQCAREYEGKGAFPDYVGPDHAEAMRKAAAIGVKGVWVWDFGGGWGGPILQNDRWVRLNIEATSRLAQNPGLDPRAIARDWAAKEFGDRAADRVTDLLMLSSDCVRKFMYIEPYARDHHGWKPSLNLMRDDIIRGEVLRQLYDGSKQALPEVYAEKEESVTLATRMRALFESSRTDIVAERGQRVYDESLSSLIYLQGLATVVCHYVNGMFSYYQWQETHDPATAARAQQELLAWRDAWRHYQADVPGLLGVATIYHSQNRTQNPTDASPNRGAMAELCETALHDLVGKSSGHADARPAGGAAALHTSN